MSQPPQFFVDHKRGEVNEIKAILRNPKAIKDPAKKREVIKKVIAYMTLGIDVSRIFGEMIMAANTKDLVQKKMVYHYLCSYAAQKSDMAILAINTLQNDCRDDDPMTRGLALRSLCSLRLPNMTEYVMLPIRKGLNDPSPYVRANAVTGVAKLFRTCPESVKGSDLVDILYNILKDKDSMVITDAINALNEILAAEGGMVFNTQIVTYLLNRLREFNEWGQCTVLDLVAKYTPQNDTEMYNIMNMLEDRLKHSNSAVVMGTSKVFLNFSRDNQNNPNLHKDVFKRLRPPMLTLMGSGGVELAYCVLSHIQVLVNREPGIFDDDYKHFFVKFNDPLCLKKLKLDVLSSLANGKNFADILNELAEYVTDVNMEIARASIRNVGKILLRIPAAVDEAIEHLLGFLDLNIEYVSGESIIALRDLLRRYPERSEEIVPNLANFLKGADYEAEGKSAVIWIIGEYGENIEDAPYLLEAMIDSFDEEPSHAVRQQLLTASMKLFFKRAPEMQKMLGRLLKKAIEDTSKVDVRDRALLFYRLLQVDLNEAQTVVTCPKITVAPGFLDAEAVELQEKIFLEFNSLCPIYEKPSSKFVKYVPPEDEPTPVPEQGEDVGDEGKQEGQEEGEDNHHIERPYLTERPAERDFLEEAMQNVTIHTTEAPAPVASAPAISLDPVPTIDAAKFQQNWPTMPQVSEFSHRLTNPAAQTQIEQSFAAKAIHCMASGTQGSMMKFYFYATTNGQMFLLEANLDLPTNVFGVKVKSNAAPDTAAAFLQYLQSALSAL